jgi:uncharacterized UBP type Zn finger protein
VSAVTQPCSHLGSIRVTETSTHVCPECVALGDTWLHLRLCLECGQVGCCDSSKNRHATAHFRASTHPLVRSIQPGESWVWCYADDLMVGQL